MFSRMQLINSGGASRAPSYRGGDGADQAAVWDARVRPPVAVRGERQELRQERCLSRPPVVMATPLF
jgi:hypothetical protein